MVPVYDSDVRYGSLLLFDEQKREEFFDHVRTYAEDFSNVSFIFFERAAAERALENKDLFEKEFRALEDVFLFVAGTLYHARGENLFLRYNNALYRAVTIKMRNSIEECERELIDVALRSNYDWGGTIKNMIAGVKNTAGANSYYAIVFVLMFLFELFDYTVLCEEGRDIIFH